MATWGFCLNLKPYDAALSATLACAQTLARTREAQEGGFFLVGILGLLYRADRYSAQGIHERKVFRGESDGQKRPKKEKPSKAMPRK